MVASARAAVHDKMIRLQNEVWREHVDAKINTGDANVLGLEPDAPRGQSVLYVGLSAAQTVEGQKARTDAYADAPRVFGVWPLKSPRRPVRPAVQQKLIARAAVVLEVEINVAIGAKHGGIVSLGA